MKTAIEVGKEVISAEVRNMDRNEAKVLASLILMRRDFDQDKLLDEAKPMAYEIAKKRLDAFGVPVEARVCLMIAALSDRPGTAVLYCAAVKAIAAGKGNGEPVSIEEFAMSFPMGFPTEGELQRIWNGQKTMRDPALGALQSDNSLDRKEAWL